MSKKGSVWKKHKYFRKDGDRYFYKTDMKDITGIEDPNLVGGAEDLSRKIDESSPVIKKIREVYNTPIWSPNKEDETLISKGHELVKEFLGGSSDEKYYAKK